MQSIWGSSEVRHRHKREVEVGEGEMGRNNAFADAMLEEGGEEEGDNESLRGGILQEINLCSNTNYFLFLFQEN